MGGRAGVSACRAFKLHTQAHQHRSGPVWAVALGWHGHAQAAPGPPPPATHGLQDVTLPGRCASRRCSHPAPHGASGRTPLLSADLGTCHSHVTPPCEHGPGCASACLSGHLGSPQLGCHVRVLWPWGCISVGGMPWRATGTHRRCPVQRRGLPGGLGQGTRPSLQQPGCLSLPAAPFLL